LFLLLVVILPYANLIGVPYIAYRFLIGEPADSRETLHAVKRFWPRVIGFFCVVGLIISPFLLIAFFVTQNYSPTPGEVLPLLGKILALFSLPFGSLLDFCLFGFFRNNDDLSQGLRKTWSLFRHHFWTLSVLSVVIYVLFHVSLFLTAILTVLLQNGFDLTYVGQIHFLNPGLLLINNPLYLFLSGVGSTILIAFSSLVYGSAYLQYSGVNVSKQDL
jgi:hypothetical protein